MFEDQFESSGSNNKQNPTTVDFHAAWFRQTNYKNMM